MVAKDHFHNSNSREKDGRQAALHRCHYSLKALKAATRHVPPQNRPHGRLGVNGRSHHSHGNVTGSVAFPIGKVNAGLTLCHLSAPLSVCCLATRFVAVLLCAMSPGRDCFSTIGAWLVWSFFSLPFVSLMFISP
jgi:hypothetical protein